MAEDRLELILTVANRAVSLGTATMPLVREIVDLIRARDTSSDDAPTWDAIQARIAAARATAQDVAATAREELTRPS